MAYQERLALYNDIEALRGRPLICYVTSIRPQASGQIAGDVISELIKQINEISDEYQEVDFLVVSNGGDPIAAARIVSLLRERFEKVSVLIPYVAYSAATMGQRTCVITSHLFIQRLGSPTKKRCLMHLNYYARK